MGRAEDILLSIRTRGIKAIEEFYENREYEDLFLDFKRTATKSDSNKLDYKDRLNLAKAISGFGNSEGGLIVWGLDCSKDSTGADIAHTSVPINNPVRFASWLESVVSGCTVPPHSKVTSEAIAINEDEGYVVTYIPKSNHAPHQVTLSEYQHRYYIRAGSDFITTPHSVLAGMFGRRPQPHLSHDFFIAPAQFISFDGSDIIKIQTSLTLKNFGPGIARDMFVNAIFSAYPGEACKINFEKASSYFEEQKSFGIDRKSHDYIIMCKPDFRLAPEAAITTFRCNFFLKPPFTEDLKIDLIYGCNDMPSMKFPIYMSLDKLNQVYEESLNKKHNDSLDDEYASRASIQLLRID